MLADGISCCSILRAQSSKGVTLIGVSEVLLDKLNNWMYEDLRIAHFRE